MCLRETPELFVDLELWNSQILWIGVSGGVRLGVRLVGPFDLFAVGEGDAGADEGDEVGCVDGAPAGLGGLRQKAR